MKRKVKQKIIDPATDGKGQTVKYVMTIAYVDRFSWPEDDQDEWRMASLFVHIIAWFGFSCIIAYNVIA